MNEYVFFRCLTFITMATFGLLMAEVTCANQPALSPETVTKPVVMQIRLESDWNGTPSPGVSLTFNGGGLANNGFPAISADHSRIALLYMADHPMVRGYPIFEVWSIETLKRLRRVQMVPGYVSATEDHVDVDSPEVLAAVERQLLEVNRILAKGDFQPMKILYDTQSIAQPVVGLEMFGKEIDYPGAGADKYLTIASTATGRTELKLKMPIVQSISGSEDPLNDCEVQGNAEQAWYEPEHRVIVVRMTFISPRDGCEQPEKWILKRL